MPKSKSFPAESSFQNQAANESAFLLIEGQTFKLPHSGLLGLACLSLHEEKNE